MYFPTTRVLTVLELLQSRQQISGIELAKRLEVDQRTVRRYVTMLQDMGIPVESRRGRYGAYHLRPGFKLPPLMFRDDEAFALTIGLIAVRKLGLAVAAPAVESVLAKIERVLPLALKEHVRAVQETLVFDFNPAKNAPASEVVTTLCIAALQKRRVMMHYQAWNGEATERPLDPYGLVCRSGFWYTVGYCHLRQDLRSFRLDRIVSVAMHEETFVPPLDFDCLEFVVRSLPMIPATWLIDVLLETTLEEARSMVSPVVAILEQEEHGVVFRSYVSNLDWIAYVLAGLRCPLVIRNPPELRDAMHRLANNITSMAERTL
ncbi:MAG: YafY family protein [Ktedonobacteraceae bacterium]